MNPALSIEQAMASRLAELAKYRARIYRFQNDRDLARRAGYEALHLAREAAELVFRQRHPGIEAVAPGVVGRVQPKPAEDAARSLIKRILANEIGSRDPLVELTAVIEHGKDSFAVGVAAVNACVALLGLGEYGGVFGAWQMQVLAFDYLTWEEHVAFNRRILEDAKRLDPESSSRAAAEHGLPESAYLEAGCLGNIAKACYQAVAEEEHSEVRGMARKTGDQAMDEISRNTPAAIRDKLLWHTMQAMRTSAADALDGSKDSLGFWREHDAVELLSVMRRLEPSKALVEMVARSAGASNRTTTFDGQR